MPRHTKQATIKHWKRELEMHKYFMTEYLIDSFNLDLPKDTRLYCNKNFVESKSLVNNAYKKLTKLGA